MERNLTVTPELLAALRPAPGRARPPRWTTGHINDTFLLQAPERRLVLQRINHFVFPSPRDIMENIQGGHGVFAGEDQKAGGRPGAGDPHRGAHGPGGELLPGQGGQLLAVHRPYRERLLPRDGGRPPPCWRRPAGPSGGSSACCATTPPAPSTRSSPTFHNTPVPATRQLQEAAARRTPPAAWERSRGSWPSPPPREEDCGPADGPAGRRGSCPCG